MNRFVFLLIALLSFTVCLSSCKINTNIPVKQQDESNNKYFAYYKNGWVTDLNRKVIATYANGFVLDTNRKVCATYRNGYVFNLKGTVFATYRNGFVKYTAKKASPFTFSPESPINTGDARVKPAS